MVLLGNQFILTCQEKNSINLKILLAQQVYKKSNVYEEPLLTFNLHNVHTGRRVQLNLVLATHVLC
jgi:hypothetical protein